MTEYDELKTVVVGRDFDCNYIIDKELKYSLTLKGDFDYDKFYNDIKKNLRERNESLDKLSEILESKGVKVFRPKYNSYDEIVDDLGKDVADTQNFDSNARDIFIVIEDKVIIAPTFNSRRNKLYKLYENVFEYLLGKGYKIIYPPETNGKRDFDYYPITTPVDFFVEKAHEYAPMFETANLIKAKDGVVFNISNHNHYSGYLWFKEIVDCDVFPCFVDYGHIDGGMNIVNDDLLLLCFNSDHISESEILKKIPTPFKKCDVITVDKNPKSYKRKTDVFLASKGGMEINSLSINPNTIIISKNKSLKKKLNDRNIDVIEMSLKHDRLFNGGVHCVTVDLERSDDESTLSI